jgi:chorismate mutase
MDHRHLNHQRPTLAALDDIIARGGWQDWQALRLQALAQPAVLAKLIQICTARTNDPSSQRHHFWLNYAKAHMPEAETV